MKLKLDEHGNVVLQDGKPVYVKDDGTEVAFDVIGTVATISRLNAEARTHRTAKEEAETKLQAFVDLDPAKAREALEKLKDIDLKKLVDSGKLDEVRNEMKKAYEPKLTAAEERAKKAEARTNSLLLGDAFSRSKFIPAKMANSPVTVQAIFGGRYIVENDQVVPLDDKGNKLHSLSNPGELATFDEALEIMVNNHPDKASLLKSDMKPGSGAPAGGKPNGGAGKVLTRPQWEQLDALARSKHFTDGGTIVDA